MRVDGDVMAALEGARCEGPLLFLKQKMDRTLYARVAKVVEAAGGGWSRKDGAHVFDGTADEAIEPILLTGEATSRRQDFGQFDTPHPTVERLLDFARLEPGMSLLEPSAGIGNIAVAAIGRGAMVTTCELDPRRAATLTMRIAGLPHSPASDASEGVHADFLSLSSDKIGLFDRVVMNPPFAHQADIDHVRHATSFLKPGGRLVSIMSAGIRFRTNRKATDFRTFLGARGGHIEPLAEGSFAESGTNVSAVIVVVPGRSA